MSNNAATAGWDQVSIDIFASKSDADIATITGKSVNAVQKKRNRLIEAGLLSVDPDEEFASSLRQQKELLKERAGQQFTARLLKERGNLELILDALRAGTRAIPYTEHPRLAPIEGNYEYGEEEAVLLLGDMQVGEVVDITTTGGLGYYNKDVFANRLNTLRLKVERIIKGHRAYQPIKVLNILGLGDFVEGVDIYPGQAHHIDMHSVQQLFYGTNELAQTIIYWSGMFDRINLFGVLGNHGRIGRKGEAPTTMSMDYLFLKHLEMLLANYIDEGKIVAEFPETWFQLVERQGKRFLLLHGDDFKSWMSIPFYGAQRALQRWSDLIDQRFDYMVFGHHHVTAGWESNAQEVIANGSFVGTNELSAKVMTIGGRPSQWLFGLHAEHGLTYRYRLFLDDNEPSKVVPVYYGKGNDA